MEFYFSQKLKILMRMNLVADAAVDALHMLGWRNWCALCWGCLCLMLGWKNPLLIVLAWFMRAWRKPSSITMLGWFMLVWALADHVLELRFIPATRWWEEAHARALKRWVAHWPKGQDSQKDIHIRDGSTTGPRPQNVPSSKVKTSSLFFFQHLNEF